MKHYKQTCAVFTPGKYSDCTQGGTCPVQLPEGTFRKIVLKPNWVRHEEDKAFPIEALVTSSSLIEIVIDACLEKYPEAEEITVGDVPLQGCNWRKLVQQAKIDRIMQKYERYGKPRIQFLDLRRECAESAGGYLRRVPNPSGGDPKGYREVLLDESSFLDPISGDGSDFRVSDYSPEQTTSSHRRGFHRYLIAASLLDCDLFINLPKVKTHQKSGITGALKNLVGVNGQKAYLVHYRKQNNGAFGDEFPPNVASSVVWQTRIREVLQGRSELLFRALRPGWRLVRQLTGVETLGTLENLTQSKKRFYLAGGSWYGNDTIWRMVYDLNRIIRYAPRDGGPLSSRPQREYFAIADGLIAGEGNGPLQPLPVQMGVLMASGDPFLLDTVMAQIMGFDYKRIPLLVHAKQFDDNEWGTFDPEKVQVDFDEKSFYGIDNIPVLRQFEPPPGWKHHIERQIFEEQV